MNTLVVYDSRYGNTEQIAKVIAHTLNEFGIAHTAQVGEVTAYKLADVDLLVLGCPTQGWRPTHAMLTFLGKMPPRAWVGLDVACFDTRIHLPRLVTGSAACTLVRRARKLGALLLMAPESFFVTGSEGPLEEGEAQRAAHWAKTLHSRIEAHNPVTHPM